MSGRKFVVSEQIKEQLKTLPMEPGVYLMRDKEGEIIYVGKSKLLKNRVSSYFRGFESHMPKVQTMVVNIKSFDYILTDTEMEALILEATLIKKHQPRFNILLKDDKNYPYIAISMQERFPRVFMTRNTDNKSYKYFGPYTSVESVRIVMEIIQNHYPLRECSKKITDKIERPCLNYHIGRCAGVCNHMITEEAYFKYIQEISLFLTGDKKAFIKKLSDKMYREAEAYNFEQAAVYRDQIEALKALSERQKVLQIDGRNQDFIAYYQYESRTCVMLFKVREGKIDDRESYEVDNAEHQSASEILSSFMLQYYAGNADVPKEIYLSEMVEGLEVFSQWLSRNMGYKVTCSVPIRGDKKQTITLVEKNAKEYIMKFKDKIDREEALRHASEKELRELLDFPDNLPLNRIEAYDISNTSGVYSVGSMVVYQNGKKKKSDYRRYRVKTIEGPNDYGSMQEVLYRRFKRGLEEKTSAIETGLETAGFSVFPDLLLIDGGKGHVNAVLQVLNAMKLYIPVVGMVKDDFHHTDDLIYEGRLLGLKEKKSAFRLVSEIQDEVHRFAIEYHKSLRSKEMLHSELEEIHGIGEKKRIALLKHFKTINAIKNATIDQLLEVDGISKSNAESISEFFGKHTENSENIES